MTHRADEPGIAGMLDVRPKQRDVARLVTAVVAVGCAMVFVRLLGTHTTGGEIDGVIVAAAGVAAAVLSLAFLAAHRRRTVAGASRRRTGGPWSAAPAVAPAHRRRDRRLPGSLARSGARHPFSDPRPRPPLAPLVLSGLGIAGAAALVAGSRAAHGARRG